MIGFRHTDQCNCGCQFVVGLVGEVVERYDWLAEAVVTFEVPNGSGGAPREQQVAYHIDDVLA